MRTDGHVAAGHQSDRTAEGCALHHCQRRQLEVVEAVHQFGQLASVGEVGIEIQLRRLLHPGQIRPGRKMLAAAAQQQEAQALVRLYRVDCLYQLADHFGVEGVVLFRSVEPQGGEAARVFVQFDGLEIGHLLLLYEPASGQYCALSRALHPEYAEPGRFDRCVETRRDCQAQQVARLRRINNTVIPQSRA